MSPLEKETLSKEAYKNNMTSLANNISLEIDQQMEQNRLKYWAP